MRVLGGIAILCLIGCWQLAAAAQEPSATQQNRLQLPTLGGKQFWTDKFVYHDWRIQCHAVTGHCRLLDGEDLRRASGTFERCKQQFDILRRQLNLPPVEGKVVLLLHGLGRSRSTMQGLAGYLEEEGGYTALTFGYASTRGSVASHAAALRQVISSLGEEVEQIQFVAHSMGNVVIRYYLAEDPDRRIKRIVMLAPPNQGSEMAERLKHSQLFRLIAGVSGSSLSEDWEQLEQQLVTPSCEFGIIAGALGDELGGSPLIEGPDDLVVAVEETRLAGAADFAVVPSIHTTIMDHPVARQYVLRFLQEGSFISPEARDPIGTAAGDAHQPELP